MSNIPSPQSFIFSDDYVCRWDSCLLSFDDAEVLYEHIKNAHVGRKAQHNLCLTCKWDGCSSTFNKRDHITSHVRVHVDLKPFGCSVCQKVFKRPQDLKKHEKIHTDEELRNARVTQDNAGDTNGISNNYHAVAHSSSLLPPGSHDQVYQPLSPQSYTDRSPSIASSTVSTLPSPYNTPLSPTSMNDPTELWNNPGLASPFSTNSEDLFNSPRTSNLEVDLMNRSMFGRPTIDISNNIYGPLPTTSSGLEDIISPQSAKRPHDGFEELLYETIGSLAQESKKKRLDHPTYDEDTQAHLNALAAVLEIGPVTPESLSSAFPNANSSEMDQFSHYLSNIYADVSGEVFEPQAYQTLFPESEQKQPAITLDPNFGTNSLLNFNTDAAISQGLVNGNGIANGMYFGDGFQDRSIFNPVLPDNSFNAQQSMLWPGSAPVIRTAGRNPTQQQLNPSDPPQFVALQNVMKAPKSEPGMTEPVKTEPQESPTIKQEDVRIFVNVGTQTKAKQDGGQLMMQRPTEKKPSKSYESMDPTLLLMSAPSVPNTPLIVKETTDVDQAKDKDQTKDDSVAVSLPREETSSSPATGKYSDIVQRAKARQARQAEAAAAAAAAKAAEPVDPVEAMTRQLAQTRLDDSQVKVVTLPARTKPVTEGDMEKQMNAAKARALCESDPVRKQHAEVVLKLLKSIDELMAEHRKKIAVLKAVQEREAAARGVASAARNGSSRGQFSVHNQDQIRTVSSLLSSRSTVQTHQDLSKPTSQDYSKLHSSLTDHRPSSSYSDMPVLYPSSDSRASADEPFELTEEERRYIEEDNARIAAARESSLGYQSVHV